MTSHLPIPKAKHSNVLLPDPVQIHAALVELGCNDVSVEDLARLCHGAFGHALAFLSSHIVGRRAAGHVRNEIHRLWESKDTLSHPTLQRLFPHSTALSQLAQAQSQLRTSQSQLATSLDFLNAQQTLAEGAADETARRIATLSHDRTTTQLLEALQAKEAVTLKMLQALCHRLQAHIDDSLLRTEKVDKETMAIVLDRVASYCNMVRDGDSDLSKGSVRDDIKALLDTSSVESLLQVLHEHVQASTNEMNEIIRNLANKDKRSKSAVSDLLSSLHAEHISRTSSSPTSSKAEDAEHRLLLAVARSMRLPIEDPAVTSTHAKLLRKAKHNATVQLEGTYIPSPTTSMPGMTELEQLQNDAKNKLREIQCMLDGFGQLLSASRGLCRKTPRLVIKQIAPGCLAISSKAQGLKGFVDAKRIDVMNRSEREGFNDEEVRLQRDLCDSMGVPRGSSDNFISEQLAKIGVDIKRTEMFMSRATLKESWLPLDREAEVLFSYQRDHEDKLRNLLQRKVDKAKYTDAMVEEVRILVMERDVIVNGRLTEAEEKKGYRSRRGR